MTEAERGAARRPEERRIPERRRDGDGEDGGREDAVDSGGRLLFLTDEQLRQSAELMFFAYRAFTSDPDEILKAHGFWRAHHRALHFIGARRSLTVGDLTEILGVTKQSLNRVLRELIDKGLVEQRVGEKDRRQRLLALTEAGAQLERRLAEAQRARMRRAFLEAGSDAVAGFQRVLEKMLDPDQVGPVRRFIRGGDHIEQAKRGEDGRRGAMRPRASGEER